MNGYIKKRGKNFYFRRRVPLDLVNIEGRDEIIFSLKTDSENVALQKSSAMNEQLNLRWAAFRAGEDADAEKYWQATQNIAKSYGLPYKSSDELLAGDGKEILKRLELLESKGQLSNPQIVDAALGTAKQPKIKLSQVLELYWSHTKKEQTSKSPNQLRKWKNPRIKAIKNLQSVIGDKAITDITRNDALDFRDWWVTRMIDEGLTANSANKDITHISTILRVVCERFRIPWASPFEKLRFREEGGQKAPPYSNRFIQANFLDGDCLGKLDPDHRLIVYILIETGARPGEIVNLPADRIRLNAKVPHIEIAPQEKREVKTRNANRIIPLVGISLWAMRQCPNGFPALHDREDSVSANVNKFIRNNGLKETEDHILYSLRASFQDRMLMAVHPDLGPIPERIQADLMGHSTERPKYGQGASLEQLQAYLKHMSFSLPHWAK